jgi:hypothetical protein
MRHSIYILLATSLIKADIKHALRLKRKLLRPIKVDLDLSADLLMDIGINPDGFAVGERFTSAQKAHRIVRYLRYIKSAEIIT